MLDHHQLIPSIGIVTDESSARRAECLFGHMVRLADGETWWLPRIDYAFLSVRPDLRAAISRTFDLAGEVGLAESDVRRHAMVSAIYHSQLLQLGVVLLRENYELPEGHWLQLVSFEDNAELFRMTLAVSDAIAESITTWLPLYQPGGRDAIEDLLLH